MNEISVDHGGKGKKRKYGENGLLFQVHWKRVVLDEGQVVKNPRTRVAQACWGLTATHRRANTNTAISNC
jgi:SWI/SNF-related matrix-associated actin-dependent regulator of chromatin subfamily A3